MHSSIKFNGKDSLTDLGWYIDNNNGRIIGAAPKKRVTQEVPYASITYDFTTYYGRVAYGERTLTYTFTRSFTDMADCQLKIRQLREWLDVAKMPLYDSTIPNYHFNAICTQINDPTISGKIVKITVIFTASAYMVSRDYGEDVLGWDGLIFDDTHYLNKLKHTTLKSQIKFKIYSDIDHKICPYLTVTGNDTSYKLTASINGNTTAFEGNCDREMFDTFVIVPGMNEVTLSGTGTLGIELVEEVL